MIWENREIDNANYLQINDDDKTTTKHVVDYFPGYLLWLEEDTLTIINWPAEKHNVECDLVIMADERRIIKHVYLTRFLNTLREGNVCSDNAMYFVREPRKDVFWMENFLFSIACIRKRKS